MNFSRGFIALLAVLFFSVVFWYTPRSVLASAATALATDKANMASRTGVSIASITGAAVAKTFDDTCCGCPSAGVCGLMFTDGYVVTLDGGGYHYVYHNHQDGSIACLYSASAPPPTVVPTPTSILPVTTYPGCDSTCGVCGVRTDPSTCVQDWGNEIYELNCCHMGCAGSPASCQYVHGGGSYSCAACAPPPTPTGAVIPTVASCGDAGFYPQGVSFDSASLSPVNFISNDWMTMSFTPSFSGTVNGVLVKAGSQRGGSFTNHLDCKVTDSMGTVDISTEGSSVDFNIDAGEGWKAMSFQSAEFSLTGGTNYQLRCKQNLADRQLYWMREWPTDLKTYAICMDPVVVPTAEPTAVVTLAPTPTEIPVTGIRNHVCDPVFFTATGERIVKFNVTVTDPDNSTSPVHDEIQIVELRFGDGTDLSLHYDMTAGISVTGLRSGNVTVGSTATTNGSDKTVTFAVTFNDLSGWPAATDGYDLFVYAEDTWGGLLSTGVGGWMEMNRQFKVWDCVVEVVGTVYDSSADLLAVCPHTGYSIPIADSVGFGGLMYEDVSSLYKFSNRTMTADNDSDYHSDNANHLIFGQQYAPDFDPELLGTDPVLSGLLKITDVNDGERVLENCPAATRLNITNQVVNPYQTEPKIKVDYVTAADQGPWFQVTSGGIGAMVSILDNIPVTCAIDTTCIPAIAIGGLGGSNGLVAAPIISNSSGCGSLCKYGEVHDWGLESNVIGEKYDYDYFRKIMRPAVVSEGNTVWSNLGAGVTGVVFVNGNLSIDEDIVRNPVGFLMVVVSGKITVQETVNQVDGIFLANGGFETPGVSAEQLVINGVIYTPGGDISLTRGYTDKIINNTKPAVLVNYRSDLMFNLPAELTKVLSGWKEGR
ncbi:MAG: hypothetical protein WC841_02520 [Candidatus Shapirobacteria bacterium]